MLETCGGSDVMVSCLGEGSIRSCGSYWSRDGMGRGDWGVLGCLWEGKSTTVGKWILSGESFYRGGKEWGRPLDASPCAAVKWLRLHCFHTWNETSTIAPCVNGDELRWREIAFSSLLKELFSSWNGKSQCKAPVVGLCPCKAWRGNEWQKKSRLYLYTYISPKFWVYKY